MKDALLGAGVPPDRISSKHSRGRLETKRPSSANPGIARRIAGDSRHSGLHMTRALGTFRAAGIPAVPAIAREFDPEPSLASVLLPSKEGLGLAEENAHEVIGIAYYWLRGWWRR